MKKAVAALLSLVALLATGCASGTPKAVLPQNSHDFGDVPVVADMSKVRVKDFVIKNEGNGNLKLSDIQVKTLEGCWPPQVTVGSTVVKPGASTSFVFPYAMHPGMGGKHHFEVRMKTNDPAQQTLVFHVYANSLEVNR